MLVFCMVDGLDRADFRRRLMEMRAELETLNEKGRDATKPVALDQSKVGRLSRMDALQNQAMAQETHRRRLLDVKRIEAALQRLDEDEYGYCIVCGEAIGQSRLEADPAAAACVAHAK